MGLPGGWFKSRFLIIGTILFTTFFIVVTVVVVSTNQDKSKLPKNGPRPGSVMAPNGGLGLLNPPNKDFQMDGTFKDRPKVEEYIMVENGVTSTVTGTETVTATTTATEEATSTVYTPTTLETVVRPPVTEDAAATAAPTPEAQAPEPQLVQTPPAPIAPPVTPQEITQNEQGVYDPQEPERLTIPQFAPPGEYIQPQAQAEHIQEPVQEPAPVQAQTSVEVPHKVAKQGQSIVFENSEPNSNPNIAAGPAGYVTKEKGVKTNQQMQEIANDIVY
ncbi:hypothetical protein TWF281_008095 [Arthrobotrys megalospora]